VDNAATGCHELEIALLDGSLVACEVFVVDGAREKIRDSFLTYTDEKEESVYLYVFHGLLGASTYLCVGGQGNLRPVEWQSGRA
jgi:hypothetical protein